MWLQQDYSPPALCFGLDSSTERCNKLGPCGPSLSHTPAMAMAASIGSIEDESVMDHKGMGRIGQSNAVLNPVSMYGVAEC